MSLKEAANNPTFNVESWDLNKKELIVTEASDKIGGDVMYYGNTVLILGENYYSDQIVTVKNPQRVGTYSYTTNGGMPKTVPVIDGQIE